MSSNLIVPSGDTATKSNGHCGSQAFATQ